MENRLQRYLIFFGKLSFLVAVFMMRWHMTDPNCSVVFSSTDNGKVKLSGFISQMPDERHENTRLTVTAENGEKFIVTVLSYPRFAYGDTVEINGKRTSPYDSGHFLYAKYLESQGICSLFYQPYVGRTGGNAGNPFWKWMYAVKGNFLSHLEKLFPEPSASFAAGLLLGDRKGLPEEVTRHFRRAGVTHIIALSGYNITILFVFVIFLLQRFPIKIQFAVSIVIMVWFVLLTGAAPGIVRASIMGFLWFFGKVLGRKAGVKRALFLSAGAMLFFNPRLIVYDPGFELSFLATYGLITFGERISKWFSWIPTRLIRESFCQTLAATIPTLPILIFYFGQVSFVSPFANVFILPLIPFAMLFSGIPLFLDYIMPQAAVFMAWWGNAVLFLILKIAEWFSSIPYASWPDV